VQRDLDERLRRKADKAANGRQTPLVYGGAVGL